MVFHWSLNDSKSPQVSRTLLRILAILNNAVVWMVSTRPSISKSSSPFNNPLITVPKAPIMIGIIVTFMFHSFFQFPSKVEVLILFTFLQFYSVVSQDSKICSYYYYYYYYYRAFHISVSWWFSSGVLFFFLIFLSSSFLLINSFSSFSSIYLFLFPYYYYYYSKFFS